MAADRRPFHKACVKCSECSKRLSPATINEHNTKLFCNSCYENIYMPKDVMIPERVSMQVLPVDGTYSAAEEARRRAEQERLLREQEEQARKMAQLSDQNTHSETVMTPVGMLHIAETVTTDSTEM